MYSRYKYPRTPHLPDSPGAHSDDVRLSHLLFKNGDPVVITEKMDGENTTIYRDYCHARSIDSAHHPSRAKIKALAARIGPLLPEGWRICGENLYARHSVAYENLPADFLLFSVWDDQNRCLCWEESREWAQLLELSMVPILYEGPFTELAVKRCCEGLDLNRQEGLVVRNGGSFSYEAFTKNVAKWVRPGHVQTDEHWMSRAVVPNGVRREKTV